MGGTDGAKLVAVVADRKEDILLRVKGVVKHHFHMRYESIARAHVADAVQFTLFALRHFDDLSEHSDEHLKLFDGHGFAVTADADVHAALVPTFFAQIVNLHARIGASVSVQKATLLVASNRLNKFSLFHILFILANMGQHCELLWLNKQSHRGLSTCRLGTAPMGFLFSGRYNKCHLSVAASMYRLFILALQR